MTNAALRTLVWVVVVLAVAPGVAADPIERFFAARGPHDTVSDPATGPAGDFTLFRPAEPGLGGVKHPVITWGNGTLANPDDYFEFLDHLASHGFVVIASNSGFTGSGEAMLRGVDWVIEQNADPGSPLFDTIAVEAVGASGHSQGGGGTINAGRDPRIVCTAPVQPAGGNVEGLVGPMFVMAGGRDVLVPPESVRRTVYQPARVPSVFGILADATHGAPGGDADGYRGYVTTWFVACLKGNAIAAQAFIGRCTLCRNPAWEVSRKRASGP